MAVQLAAGLSKLGTESAFELLARAKILEAEGRDETFVSRLRSDPSVDNGVLFWCVTDNLRKGAATNALQIAEALLERQILSIT